MMIKKKSMLSVIFLIILGFFWLGSHSTVAQENSERAEISLTNPSKIALVKVNVMMGTITVTGHSGKNVIVEAKKLQKSKKDFEFAEKKDKEKTRGMHVIKNTSIGLTIEEEENIVNIKTTRFMERIAVTVKVPFKSNLKIRNMNGRFIKVNNVEGELEIKHSNGRIELDKISGTVVANTVNGDIKIAFDKVNLDKPMSFTTMNGDIDLTFPQNAKFNLNMNAGVGEVYSDFKLTMKPNPKPMVQKKKEGKTLYNFSKGMYGQLNGGGEEILLKTFHGDIYLRKK
jgi:hypothetical protein